ncbi:TPR repeat-containing protein YrrB [termite gut metagenome]|uniref:TPR repeat-containing protein YrrB n=1 Tax=termite gut metagenome TaxID=433724 RepID=A0A5J4R5Y2_9ZZZZ
METKSTTHNPRTENQQAQRAQLTNLVTTYQTLSSFIRGAYPSKPKNLSDYNMFIKENLSSRVKVYLNKAEAFQKACIVAPYNISEGRLQGIETVVQGDVLRTSLRVPRSFQINDDTTVEDVSMAMLRANPQMQEGDQISILHLIQHVPEKGVPHVTWKQYDFTLDTISYGAIHSEFYSDIPKSLFRVNDGCIETEAGIEMGGVAYVLSREVGRKVQISTQSIVLTPDNSIYKEYSSEEKKKEAAGSYAIVAKKKMVAPKKVVNPKNEYLHGFISKSKKILSMKKILIALVLIFGITIAAQNNTAGQEKTYSQEEVNLMMQVQELKISEMQKSVEDKIGMQDKYIDNAKENISEMQRNVEDKIGMQDKYVVSINNRFGFWIGLFGGLMTFLSIGLSVGVGFLIYYLTNLNKRSDEWKQELIEMKEKEINNKLIEINGIIEETIKNKEAVSEVSNQAKEELSDIRKIKEEIQSDKTPNEQTPELQKKIKVYATKTSETKPIAEYTADDWLFLGYDAHMEEKHEDACFYYKKAVDINPNDAEAYYNWGNALSNFAQLKSDSVLFEESFEKYRKAIDINPNDAKAYYHWGNALSDLGELKSDSALFEESFGKFRKAIEVNLNYAKVYTNWGITILRLARLKSDPALFEESFGKFRKATEMNPDDAKAYYGWGTALSVLARLKSNPALYEKSLDKYKKAIEMKPDYVNAYNNWGNALYALAQLNSDEALYKESCEKYSKASELNPNNANTYNNWGNALSDLAELKSDPAFFEESFDKYRKAIENKLDYADAYYNWRISLKQLARIENNIEKLLSHLEEYLKYYKDKITRSDIENDADFAILKGDPYFQQFLEDYFPKEKS